MKRVFEELINKIDYILIHLKNSRHNPDQNSEEFRRILINIDSKVGEVFLTVEEVDDPSEIPGNFTLYNVLKQL